MTDCKTNCPVSVKNTFLGCTGRPMKYQKECPRLKEFEKQLKRRAERADSKTRI